MGRDGKEAEGMLSIADRSTDEISGRKRTTAAYRSRLKTTMRRGSNPSDDAGCRFRDKESTMLTWRVNYILCSAQSLPFAKRW